jgi:flagellar assembly protein FliH
MRWRRTISPGRSLRDVRVLPAGWPGAAGETSEAGERQREQAAFERGLAEGEKRLSQQLLRQRAEMLALQNGVLASLRQAPAQVVRESESALIRLALEVARKLVSGLPISGEMVEAAIRSALAQVEANCEFDVLLHADDLALLQECNSPVLLPGPGNEAVRFQASGDIPRGGCVVHTRFGSIDATREKKLELIRQCLDA